MNSTLLNLKVAARALGDGSLGEFRLGGDQADADGAAAETVSLLGEPDPNIRVGAYSSAVQNAPLLAKSEVEPRSRLERALDLESVDRAAHDYSINSQIDELDVVFVRDEAESARSALRDAIN